MRDLVHSIYITQATPPAVTTANVTSAAIDLQGYNALAVTFDIGASGDTLNGSNNWTLKLQHSDDNSTYTDVLIGDLLNNNATILLDANAKVSTVYSFGYVGPKRYVKALCTKAGTISTGMALGVVALRGHASIKPTNNTNFNCVQTLCVLAPRQAAPLNAASQRVERFRYVFFLDSP